jgi:hypothetical protein
MTDSTPSSDGDPDGATMPDAAKESVGAATDAVKLAYEIQRQAMEAWHTAIQRGDPELTEIAKAGVDRAMRGITEALRILDITHATGQGAARTLEAQMIQLLMLQAEAGAEQRARATGELMQAANSQAASLKWATWALAGTTVVLVFATVLLILVTAGNF